MGDFYLEPYQNWKISVSSLDKYDRFYRVLGNPLVYMNATDVFRDCNLLQILLVEEMVKDGKAAMQVDHDRVPYVKFIEFFEHQKQWNKHM